MGSHLRSILLALAVPTCAIALMCVNLKGQVIKGTILGTVRDSTGAVVPGATVTVTNQMTNISRTVETSSSGIYEVGFLEPGRYTVTAERAGFKKAISIDNVVQVTESVRIDLGLALGNVTQQVQVTSVAPMLETTSNTLGQVINSKAIVDLPLNGRNYLQLALLSPGVAVRSLLSVETSAQGPYAGGNIPTIAGNRAESLETTLDGVSNSDPYRQTPAVKPSIDALSEFKIQTSNMTAEFGRSAAQITAQTKSGGNAFHGTGFEFVRNDIFDTRRYFDSAIPPYRQNQFGGVVSGPIVKNRTFFLFNYEGMRVRQGVTTTEEYPPAALLSGDFSDYRDSAGNVIPIYDPATTDPVTGQRQQFPGNIIPRGRMSRVYSDLVKYFPTVTGPGPYQVTQAVSDSTGINGWTARIDHQFSAKDNLMGRFSREDDNIISPYLKPLDGTVFDDWNINLGISEVHTVSPGLINEFRFGFLRARTLSANQGALGPDVLDTLGLVNVPPHTAEMNSIPYVVLTGGPWNYYTFGNGGGVVGPLDNTFQFIDNLSYTRGRHTFVWGTDIRRVRFYVFNAGAPANFFYNQDYTAQLTPGFQPVADTGDPLADFMLGQTQSTVWDNAIGVGDYRETSWEFFMSDQWKASDHLTVNWGLRYEYNGPFIEKYGRMAFLDLADYGAGRLLTPCTDKSIPYDPIINPGPKDPSACVNPGGKRNKKSFAPRLGLAYRVGQKAVVRFGWGVYYDTYEVHPIINGATNPPFIANEDLVASSNLSSNIPTDQLFPPIVVGQTAPGTALVAGITLNRGQPYVQQYNASFGYQLSPSLLIESGYMGSSGRHLSMLRNINQANLDPPGVVTSIQSRRPYPLLGSDTTEDWGTDSEYDGLYVKVEKRYSHGLQFLSSYTFQPLDRDQNSSTLDLYLGGSLMAQNDRDWRAEWGTSGNDVKNRFVVGLTYELPIGKGKQFGSSIGGVGDKLIGGWQIEALPSFQSGLPFTITDIADESNTGEVVSGRADFAQGKSGPAPNMNFRKTGLAFDPTYFTHRSFGTFGNTPRNLMRGGGINNFDLALLKTTKLNEKVGAQLRFEFFNAFNHAQFAVPIHDINFPGFGGYAANTAFGEPGIRDPREIQFGLKVLF